LPYYGAIATRSRVVVDGNLVTAGGGRTGWRVGGRVIVAGERDCRTDSTEHSICACSSVS